MDRNEEIQPNTAIETYLYSKFFFYARKRCLKKSSSIGCSKSPGVLGNFFETQKIILENGGHQTCLIKKDRVL